MRPLQGGSAGSSPLRPVLPAGANPLALSRNYARPYCRRLARLSRKPVPHRGTALARLLPGHGGSPLPRTGGRCRSDHARTANQQARQGFSRELGQMHSASLNPQRRMAAIAQSTPQNLISDAIPILSLQVADPSPASRDDGHGAGNPVRAEGGWCSVAHIWAKARCPRLGPGAATRSAIETRRVLRIRLETSGRQNRAVPARAGGGPDGVAGTATPSATKLQQGQPSRHWAGTLKPSVPSRANPHG